MFKPLSDKIVVRLKKTTDKMYGKIVLPQNSRENGNIKEGVVVAVGPGQMNSDGQRTPLTLKKGDRVLMSWGGSDVEYEREDYRILQESDVLAVLED